jgi:hypothetical protein
VDDARYGRCSGSSRAAPSADFVACQAEVASAVRSGIACADQHMRAMRHVDMSSDSVEDDPPSTSHLVPIRRAHSSPRLPQGVRPNAVEPAGGGSGQPAIGAPNRLLEVPLAQSVCHRTHGRRTGCQASPTYGSERGLRAKYRPLPSSPRRSPPDLVGDRRRRRAGYTRHGAARSWSTSVCVSQVSYRSACQPRSTTRSPYTSGDTRA